MHCIILLCCAVMILLVIFQCLWFYKRRCLLLHSSIIVGRYEKRAALHVPTFELAVDGDRADRKSVYKAIILQYNTLTQYYSNASLILLLRIIPHILQCSERMSVYHVHVDILRTTRERHRHSLLYYNKYNANVNEMHILKKPF